MLTGRRRRGNRRRINESLRRHFTNRKGRYTTLKTVLKIIETERPNPTEVLRMHNASRTVKEVSLQMCFLLKFNREIR